MSSSGKKRPPLVAQRKFANKAKPAAKKPAPAKRKKSRAPKKKQTGILGFFKRALKWLFRLFFRLAFRGAVILALLVGAGVLYYLSFMPDMDQMVDGRARGSVTMKDRYGKTFAWRGDQYGGMVTANSVSPHLKNAVVATEDKRFYRHFGISPRGVASAIKINLAAGRGALSGNGGSTITQQTAKLLCIGVPFDPKSGQSERDYETQCRRGSLWRKIKEATYAVALEVKFTKDEILSIYLNRAFLGAGARGFEAASQRYFGTASANLNPAQSAMLAGLLKAPSRYAPTNSLKRAQGRAGVVIGLMEEQGRLTRAQADEARAKPATLSKAAAEKAGGYFADWVIKTGPEFFMRDTTEDVIISTTLDPRIQRAAEAAMDKIFTEKVSKGSKAQAAIVIMSADGAVRGMVGGRQTRVTGAFNRATQAKRQTGSAFKPFVYAAALDLGYSYNDRIEDAPLTLNIPGSGPWSPQNYDRKFHGNVTLTTALKKSFNIPAVKVSESVGRDTVSKVATDFGINSISAQGPALALGSSEASLLEMTGAYAGILNGGRAVKPYGLVELRLLGNDTPLMTQGGGMGERVISADAAAQLIYMMNQVIETGTGGRARLKGREAAGKTGTTQAARDAWFVGFTADYVAGVWMGNDDNVPLRSVTGGSLPADIWRETMIRVHQDVPATALPMIVPRAPDPEIIEDNIRPDRSKPQKPINVEKFIFDTLRSILNGN
ncbi:MAG: transglycosylase domain-containing protein [Halocynthiibacter sp.]